MPTMTSLPSLKKKKPVTESDLINTVGDNFTKNSNVVKNVVSGSKTLAGPLSKSLDYLVVSLVAILLYKLSSEYL